MSKLIVDQIAKNGGAVLTLPAADGTVANQTLVTDGSGALSFSPLSMPAADGTANQALVTNASGVLGFSANKLPAADGTAGQFLTTNGSGQLVFGNKPAIVPDDSQFIIGSLVTNSGRSNIYSTGEWTSSSASGSYFHSWQNSESMSNGWNMFMGDGYPNGTSQIMYTNDEGQANNRKKEYANGDRLGFQQRDLHYYENVTSNYAGVTWRCTPIRNTTGTEITRTLNTYLSSIDSTYGGSSIGVYTPTTSDGTYANTTAGTWTTPFTGGSNTASNARNGSIVVPANTTVLVFTNSTHHYATTQRFKDSNMLINLDVFLAGDLVCDLRMLETLSIARVGHYDGVTHSVTHPWYIYPLAATMFGDR